MRGGKVKLIKIVEWEGIVTHSEAYELHLGKVTLFNPNFTRLRDKHIYFQNFKKNDKVRIIIEVFVAENEAEYESIKEPYTMEKDNKVEIIGVVHEILSNTLILKEVDKEKGWIDRFKGVFWYDERGYLINEPFLQEQNNPFEIGDVLKITVVRS